MITHKVSLPELCIPNEPAKDTHLTALLAAGMLPCYLKHWLDALGCVGEREWGCGGK